MNWDALGAIAEVLGAIAVLATLIYLARQIKEGSKAQTLDTYNAFVDGYIRLNEWLTETPERTALVMLIVEDDCRVLTPVESFHLNTILRNFANHMLRMLRLYEAGTIRESDWINFSGEARQILNATRYGRQFQANNLAFADLWRHLERVEVQHVSDFGGTGTA